MMILAFLPALAMWVFEAEERKIEGDPQCSL